MSERSEGSPQRATLPEETPADDLDARRARLALGLLVGVPLALRIPFVLSTPLSPDEAYYAAWASAPALSYLDHPPMCAWLIGVGEALFGRGLFAIRAQGLLLGLALPLLLFATARALGATRRGALWACAAASTTLLFSAGAAIVTPDTPLSLFVALAAWLGARAQREGRHRDVVGLGLALALAVASKLTGGLVALGFVLAPGLGSIGRRLAILALAGLGLVPTLAWNAMHDFPTFTFHAARMAGRGGFTLQHFGELLSAQLALLCVGPALWLGAFLWRALRRFEPGTPWRFAAVASLVPVALTFAASLFTKVEANWIGPAFLPACAGVALWLDRAAVRARWRWLVVVASAALSLVAHAHVAGPFLPIPAAKDPSAQLRLGPALAAEVARLAPEGALLASRYQEASLLRFYLPQRAPRISTLPPEGGRFSQFDLWPETASLRAAPARCLWRVGEAKCDAGGSSSDRFDVGAERYVLIPCSAEGWRARPCP